MNLNMHLEVDCLVALAALLTHNVSIFVNLLMFFQGAFGFKCL